MIRTAKIGTKVPTKNAMSLLSILLIITFAPFTLVDAKLACESTDECEVQLQPGSKCVDGFCSNPFAEGCLKTMLGSLDEDELAEKNLPPEVLHALEGRVCNSDDESPENGMCLPNEFDYFEIRVHNGNWEANIFVSWIMQIVMMEILKVPVTVGLNSALTNISSFYSPINTLEYSSISYSWDAMRDDIACETTDEDCVEVMPEVWNGQASKWTSMVQQGIIEPVDGCGQVGKLGWFVPGSTARRDESLVSYFGLAGEKNREKLAQAFKRPTSWHEYCEEVSTNNCTTADDVAQYYPDKTQAQKYFEEGNFTGYFRMLPENDCTQFPDTCTGYFVGPTCTWSTNVDAQLYWNNIVGLKPDGPLVPNHGYDYGSMTQIWRAANATKSDVMMWWWQPEVLVEEFSSTDWRFQQIILPTVTDVCSERRIGVEDRCVDDITVRRGDPLGACDYEAHALQKVISSSLQRKTMAASESSRSPGYPFLRSLKVTDLQIQSLLKKWMAIENDKYGNDARVAVCSWVVDHLDTLVDFIPPGHPRTFDPTGSFNEGYLYFAMVLAVCCFLALLTTVAVVHRYRLTKVFVYAQAFLVQLILIGFLMVTAGAFLYALEPTNFTCNARNWLTNLGFSIVLGVILVKMSIINRIMQNSKRLKRVHISNKDTLMSVGFLVLVDLVFLIAWTAVSPPQAVEKLDLPDEFSTTVKVELTCRSDQIFWPYVSVIWHTLLLIVASVLAFQSRGIIPYFNESRSIGTMIYSHFLFIVFRLIVYLLGIIGSIESNIFGASISFLYIFDTVFATAIYVIPKCIEAKKNPEVYNPRKSSSTNAVPAASNSHRRYNPNTGQSVNVEHARQPFGLNGLRNASMEMNFNSECSSVSNLRGRHRRRSRSFSAHGALSDEPSTSTNSIYEEEWKKGSILSVESMANEESIMEEVSSDLKKEESELGLTTGAANGTETRITLSSHDAPTRTDSSNGVMKDSEQE